MYIPIDVSRIERLYGIIASNLDLSCEFCPDCDFQLWPGACCAPICPDCGATLHTIRVSFESIRIAQRKKCIWGQSLHPRNIR